MVAARIHPRPPLAEAPSWPADLARKETDAVPALRSFAGTSTDLHDPTGGFFRVFVWGAVTLPAQEAPSCAVAVAAYSRELDMLRGYIAWLRGEPVPGPRWVKELFHPPLPGAGGDGP